MGNISINMFCAVITILLLVYYKRINDGSAYSVYFTKILVSTILLCLADAAWYYCDTLVGQAGYMSLDYITCMIIYASDCILCGLLSYFWFMYVERHLDSTFTCTKRRHLIAILPLVFIIIISILSIRFELFFKPDTDLSYRGPLYPLFYVILLAYLVVASAHALTHAFKTKYLHEKKNRLVLAYFMIFPIVVSLIQLVFDIPFSTGIVIALIWVLLEMQGNEVSEDALTGLNNRNRLDRELSIRMDYARQTGRTLYMLMMDANNFKQINDLYGHMEGDKVLVSIASALKKAAGGTEHFIARFGGDEFTALIFSETESKVIDFKNTINDTIARECNEPYAPYLISVSIGYASFAPEDTSSEFYAKADTALYNEKRKRKAKHDARN